MSAEKAETLRIHVKKMVIDSIVPSVMFVGMILLYLFNIGDMAINLHPIFPSLLTACFIGMWGCVYHSWRVYKLYLFFTYDAGDYFYQPLNKILLKFWVLDFKKFRIS